MTDTQRPTPNQKTTSTWFNRLTRGLFLTTALTAGILSGFTDTAEAGPKKPKNHKKPKTTEQRLDSLKKANPMQWDIVTKMGHNRATRDLKSDTVASFQLFSPFAGKTIDELVLGSPSAVRVHPIFKVKKPHYGVDIPASTNGDIPVTAGINGTITSISTNKKLGTVIETMGVLVPDLESGLGKVVPLTDDNKDARIKVKVRDLHMVRDPANPIHKGMVVGDGTILANMGEPGGTGGTQSTGKHLHREVTIIIDGKSYIQDVSFAYENGGVVIVKKDEKDPVVNPSIEQHVHSAIVKDSYGEYFREVSESSLRNEKLFGPKTAHTLLTQLRMRKDMRAFLKQSHYYAERFMDSHARGQREIEAALAAEAAKITEKLPHVAVMGPRKPTSLLTTASIASIVIIDPVARLAEIGFIEAPELLAREEDIKVKKTDLYHEEEDELLPENEQDDNNNKALPVEPEVSTSAPQVASEEIYIDDAAFYMPAKKLFGPTVAEREAARDTELMAQILMATKRDAEAKEAAAAREKAALEAQRLAELNVGVIAPIVTDAIVEPEQTAEAEKIEQAEVREAAKATEADLDAMEKIAQRYAPLTSENTKVDATRFEQTKIEGTKVPEMAKADAVNATSGFYMPSTGLFGANATDRIAADYKFPMLGMGKKAKKHVSTQTTIRGEYAVNDISERQRQNLLNQKIRINGQEITIDDNVIKAAQNAYGKNAAKDLHNRVLNKVNGTERSALVQELHKMQRENAMDMTHVVAANMQQRAKPGIASYTI